MEMPLPRYSQIILKPMEISLITAVDELAAASISHSFCKAEATPFGILQGKEEPEHRHLAYQGYQLPVKTSRI